MPLPVTIVIPTWNGRHLLERFLPSVIAARDSYEKTAAVDVPLLVVDDGSTDDTAGWLADARLPNLRVVAHERNLGFGAAANHGVEAATTPLVWLLNNDVEVNAGCIPLLAAPFEPDDGRLLAVHSRMQDLSSGADVGTGKMGGFGRGFLRVHRSYVPRAGQSGPFWSMFATGGSSMFSRARFLELGGFDPIFAPFYMEDVELSYRAWKRGFSVRYEPRCWVRHQFSSTIEPLARDDIEWISQRNRLVFNWIHLHDRPFVAAHVYWLSVLLLTAPLTLKFDFLRGFRQAVLMRGAILERRRKERARATRTDRDVLDIFRRMEADGVIRAYDDPRELSRAERV